MAKTPVFLSWSGEQSKAVAQQLKSWLPMILQSSDPWMSDRDIAAGARWTAELDKALSVARYAIVCVTPSNLGSAWLHFEAGAAAKSVKDETLVCPYLFKMTPADLPSGPLTSFQAKIADERGTRDVLESINSVLEDGPIESSALARLFDALWPELRDNLAAISVDSEVPPRRSSTEIADEMLDGIRAANRDLVALRESVSEIQRVTRPILVVSRDAEGRETVTTFRPGQEVPLPGPAAGATITDRFGTRPVRPLGVQKGGQPAMTPMPDPAEK